MMLSTDECARASATPEIAKDNLVQAGWGIDDIQAKAILELRLQRLTGMERDKIREEYDELQKLISFLKDLLSDEGKRYDVINDHNAKNLDYDGEKLCGFVG